jgi:aquaporin Z
VSLTFTLLGNLPFFRMIMYWAMQMLGGIVGALIADAIAGPGPIKPFTPLATLPDPAMSALFGEVLYTMALCIVVASVATAHSDDPNSHYALAIGFTLLSAVSSIGSVSGACLNPAVGTAVDFVALSTTPPTFTWVYWVGPIVGAVAAAGIFTGLKRAVAMDKEGPADDALLEDGSLASLASRLPLRVVVFEFLGTFFLTLTVGLGAQPLAVGAILTAFIFSSEGFCGGDFNPAVTIGALIRLGVLRQELWKCIVIVLAQTTAGIMAGFACLAIKHEVGWPHPEGAEGVYGAFVYELMWTSLLVTVVLNTTTPTMPASAGVAELYKARSSTHGIAIGMTVAVGAIGANMNGSGSGGVFNPAVGTGLSLASLAGDKEDASAIWIYWVAPIIGGVVAAGVFKLLHSVHDAADLADDAEVDGIAGLGDSLLADNSSINAMEPLAGVSFPSAAAAAGEP